MPYSSTHIIYSFNEEWIPPPTAVAKELWVVYVFPLVIMHYQWTHGFKRWVDKRQIQLMNKHVEK